MKECLPRLAKLIKSNNEAVLRDACWGVMYMCKLSIQEVLDSGACKYQLRLFSQYCITELIQFVLTVIVESPPRLKKLWRG